MRYRGAVPGAFPRDIWKRAKRPSKPPCARCRRKPACGRGSWQRCPRPTIPMTGARPGASAWFMMECRRRPRARCRSAARRPLQRRRLFRCRRGGASAQLRRGPRPAGPGPDALEREPMTHYALGALTPDVHPTAFTAPSADLIGQVTVGEQRLGVVRRGAARRYGSRDGGRGQQRARRRGAAHRPRLSLHPGRARDGGPPRRRSRRACEDGSLVGMGAVMLNGSRLGRGAVLGAGALLPEGREVPDGMLAVGVPARVVGVGGGHGQRPALRRQRRALPRRAEDRGTVRGKAVSRPPDSGSGEGKDPKRRLPSRAAENRKAEGGPEPPAERSTAHNSDLENLSPAHPDLATPTPTISSPACSTA